MSRESERRARLATLEYCEQQCAELAQELDEWKRMARMYESIAHQRAEAADEWKRRAQAIFDELTKEWLDPEDDFRTLMDPCYDEIRAFAKWFEEEK